MVSTEIFIQGYLTAKAAIRMGVYYPPAQNTWFVIDCCSESEFQALVSAPAILLARFHFTCPHTDVFLIETCSFIGFFPYNNAELCTILSFWDKRAKPGAACWLRDCKTGPLLELDLRHSHDWLGTSKHNHQILPSRGPTVLGISSPQLWGKATCQWVPCPLTQTTMTLSNGNPASALAIGKRWERTAFCTK